MGLVRDAKRILESIPGSLGTACKEISRDPVYVLQTDYPRHIVGVVKVQGAFRFMAVRAVIFMT